ncbi:carbohydrate kinase family protein [Paenibacillus humicola]|uniref:carbohydrate kinase family protein n=1 Tax=Paenibacillus humicola TaxID=3110540 RepID=UPI00237ADF9D|nr:carbohydrate kinase family protein [Paenibacillus humicola]
MAERFEAAVIGHLTVDDIVLPNGQTHFTTPGGNALYASLGLKAWGVHPVLLTCMCRNYPKEALELLTRSGIDMDRVIALDVPAVRQWALYDVQGGRKYVPIHTESDYHSISPRPPLVPEQVLGRIRAAHIAPMPIDIQEQWVYALKSRGVPYISLDPHEDWMSDADRWAKILPLLNVFMPSSVEVAAMLGSGIGEPEAARRIAVMGPPVVVLKLGERGSLVYEKESGRETRISPYPGEAVDPTGCGDAYCGGFLAGMSAGCGPAAAAEWGSVSASFVLEGYGPMAAMTAERSAASGRLAWYTAQRLKGMA